MRLRDLPYHVTSMRLRDLPYHVTSEYYVMSQSYVIRRAASKSETKAERNEGRDMACTDSAGGARGVAACGRWSCPSSTTT